MKRIPSFADSIRRAIKDSGRSRNSICKATGIDPAAMHRFFRGANWLSEPAMNALARELGLIVIVAPEAKGKTRQVKRGVDRKAKR